MKTKQRFLFTFLMAIVMMAMSPTKMWAENLEVNDGDNTTISNNAEYDNIYVSGGTLTIENGATVTIVEFNGRFSVSGGTVTIEEGATVTINESGWFPIEGGKTFNYGTINGSVVIYDPNYIFANHGTINGNVTGENWYNTGNVTGEYEQNYIADCEHLSSEDLAYNVTATCQHGGGTKSRCNDCGFISYSELATDHSMPETFTDGIKKCANCSYEAFQEPKIDTDDKTYLLANTGNLYWFRDFVNTKVEGSYPNLSACAKLTANIVVNDGTFGSDGTFTPLGETEGATPRSWTPIGFNSFNYSYTGTFDGDGHTISGLYCKDSNEKYFGLFRYCRSEATIKGVGIVNCYFNCGYGTIGAICYQNYGTIDGCYSTGTITSTDNSNAGLCIENYGTISNCYSTCSVYGPSGAYGICHTNHRTLKNCYFAGSLSSGVADNSGICYNNLSYVTNCYTTYATAIYSDSGTVAHVYPKGELSANAFSEGETAYRLNGSVDASGTWSAGTGTPVWYQRLGNDGDSYPVLKKASDGSNTVYYGYDGCTLTYANTELTATPTHDYTNNNGFCTVCGAYEPATQVTDANASSFGLDATTYRDYYAIGNAGQLFWFANGSGKNAVLTADIENVSDYDESEQVYNRPWKPFDLSYDNVFDGNNHTISRLYYSYGEEETVGLVGTNQGIIRNLGVKNSQFSANSKAGGICGYNSGGTITNCYATEVYSNSSYVGDCYAGGICGWNSNGTISNCNVTNGSAGAEDGSAGGVCGNNDNEGTITNCYATEINLNGNNAGGVCGDNNGTISNCYTDMETPIGSGNTEQAVYTKDNDAFSSGEVCYLLNGSRSEGTAESPLAWYQRLGNDGDSYPVLKKASDGSNTVYYGYADCEATGTTYANSALHATQGHSYAGEKTFMNLNSTELTGFHVCDYGCGAIDGTPTYSRTMSNEWGTLVVPFAITYSQSNTGNYKLYQLSAATVDAVANTGTLTFTEYDDNASIAAGTPMAIKALTMNAETGKYTVTISANGNAVSSAITPNAAVDGFTMNGTYENIASKVSDSNTTVYFIANNKFWWAESAISIAPFRAWFETPASSGSSATSFNIVVEGEEDASGISELKAESGMQKDGKFMENGKVVIVRNGVKYSITGQNLR